LHEAHLAAIGARLVRIQTQQLVIARAISGLRIEWSYLRVGSDRVGGALLGSVVPLSFPSSGYRGPNRS
jgi:hypothetical protein